MNNKKEKTACGAGTLQAEIKRISTKILADSEVIVKCAVTTKELNAYQELVIRRVYYMSRNRRELINGLKALQFCTYEIVVESLREQGLIDNEDYYSLITEVER